MGNPFVAWIRDVLTVMMKHEAHLRTIDAKRRSGNSKHQSGLSAGEMEARRQRDEALQNYKWSVYVAEQIGEGDPFGK